MLTNTLRKKEFVQEALTLIKTEPDESNEMQHKKKKMIEDAAKKIDRERKKKVSFLNKQSGKTFVSHFFKDCKQGNQ